MAELKIERHLDWEPSFRNEISIHSGDHRESFEITLRKNESIEIQFDWDHGYGGRGTGLMNIPLQTLKDLINEIENS